jgi:hypothetical protein
MNDPSHGRGRIVVGWVLLAVLGLVIAGGASYAASRLASEPVGLSAEPPLAGRDLVPRETATPRPASTPRPRRTPKPTPTPAATPRPAITPAPTVDDHGGGSDDSGGGRGRGRGGDD